MHDKVFSQKILNNTKNSIKLAMKENIEKDFASAALPLVLLAWVTYGEQLPVLNGHLLCCEV